MSPPLKKKIEDIKLHRKITANRKITDDFLVFASNKNEKIAINSWNQTFII